MNEFNIGIDFLRKNVQSLIILIVEKYVVTHKKMKYNLEIANKTREKALIEADAQKQAKILVAEGEAESILVVAKAKAEGVEKINRAYQNMPQQYVDVKYAEAMKDIATDGNSVVIDLQRFQGNSLPIWDMNEIAGLNSKNKLKTTTVEETVE